MRGWHEYTRIEDLPEEERRELARIKKDKKEIKKLDQIAAQLRSMPTKPKVILRKASNG